MRSALEIIRFVPRWRRCRCLQQARSNREGQSENSGVVSEQVAAVKANVIKAAQQPARAMKQATNRCRVAMQEMLQETLMLMTMGKKEFQDIISEGRRRHAALRWVRVSCGRLGIQGFGQRRIWLDDEARNCTASRALERTGRRGGNGGEGGANQCAWPMEPKVFPDALA